MYVKYKRKCRKTKTVPDFGNQSRANKNIKPVTNLNKGTQNVMSSWKTSLLNIGNGIIKWITHWGVVGSAIVLYAIM